LLLIKVADDIVIVDSFSTDATESIVSAFGKARFLQRRFDNFRNQRFFAEISCKHDVILFLDSDEIPDQEFLDSVEKLKINGFKSHTYQVKRYWTVLKTNVHSVFPIVNPDNPIRLYNRKYASFTEGHIVHESVRGFQSKEIISGRIDHYTFETTTELKRKLELYSSLAAKDMIIRGKEPTVFKLLINPFAAFIKFYILKKGFTDGKTGIILGKYAFDYTREKYRKALKLGVKRKD
jgi:glycosyltransferase involved in cell wall biosynthesis